MKAQLKIVLGLHGSPLGSGPGGKPRGGTPGHGPGHRAACHSMWKQAGLEVAMRADTGQGGAAGQFSQGTGGRQVATVGAAGWHQYGLWHMAFGTGDLGIGG